MSVRNDSSIDEIISDISSLINSNKFEEALLIIQSNLKIFSNGLEYCKLQIYSSHINYSLGRVDDCMMAAQAVIEEGNRIDEPLIIVKGMIELIYAKWMIGSLKEAYDIILQAEEILKSLPNDRDLDITRASLYNTKGIIADNLGDLQDALIFFEKSLDYRRQLNQIEDISVSLNNIAIIYQNLGKMDQAIDYLKQSLEIKMKIGNQLDIANTLGNIAIYYRRIGDYSEAISLVEESLNIYQSIGNVYLVSNALLNLILFNYAAENIDEVRKIHTKLYNLLETAKEISEPVALNLKVATAMLYLTQSKADDAIKIFEEIINDEIIDHTLYILALQYLIETKFSLSNSGYSNNIEDISMYIEILSNTAQDQQMIPLYVATVLFRAKLMMISNDLEDARMALYQALRIAEKHNLEELKTDVLREIDIIDIQIQSNHQNHGIDDLSHYIELIKKITQ